MVNFALAYNLNIILCVLLSPTRIMKSNNNFLFIYALVLSAVYYFNNFSVYAAEQNSQISEISEYEFAEAFSLRNMYQ